MIRRQPYWYSRWYSSILLIFESVFSRPLIANVFILPTYPNPVYTSDCVHLTEESGLK